MTIEEFRLNIKWWESKRWIFNSVVILSGAYSVYAGYRDVANYYWSASDTFSTVIWLIGANLLYSLGVFLELLDWYYFKNRIGIIAFRLTFFIIGTLFSCLWTYVSIRLYFMNMF